MKKVKMYTLKVEDVITSGDFIEIANWHVDNAIKIRNSDDFVLPTINIQLSRIPIEKYYAGDDKGKEYLVAFDPEIKNILQLKEKNLEIEIRELKRENEKSLKTLIDIHYNKELEYNEQITSMKNMSLLERFKFLFLGKRLWK